MISGCCQSVARRVAAASGVLGLLVLVVVGACDKRSGSEQSVRVTTLRIGVGGLPQQASQAGLRQFMGSLSVEPLAAPNDDGRMQPWLAENWTTSKDGLAIVVRLRAGTAFHDGTPVTAAVIVEALQKNLPIQMGDAFEDVAAISAVDPLTVKISLRRPSQFVVEALETSIPKPGNPGVGTGPYMRAGNSGTTLRANPTYHEGRPLIDQIVLSSYPTVRAAWAELLRGKLDMLNEVNLDALDSLEAATNVQVFSYVRHYQYMIVFGPLATNLLQPEIRRELSAAIDRDAIVREALNGHGLASLGPVPPQHWTMSGLPSTSASKQLAKNLAARHLKFKCLVPADAVYERVALVVKRQLAAVSVDMELEEASQEQVVQAAQNGTFEALLGDIVSGPTLFRSYRHWYSRTSIIPRPLGSPAIDVALDRIRHAISDGEYRDGVEAFQRAMNDDPQALFLAWSERARAVSRRFSVPSPAKNADVLNSIGLWRPAPQAVGSN
jgi:peptide/nickel transport system substrate-binding protein